LNSKLVEIEAWIKLRVEYFKVFGEFEELWLLQPGRMLKVGTQQNFLILNPNIILLVNLSLSLLLGLISQSW